MKYINSFFRASKGNVLIKSYLCPTFVLSPILIFAFLTLGVGQMWADDKGFYEVYMKYDKNGSESNYTYDGSNGSLDLGTITSSFKIKEIYLKVWDNWGDQAFEAGSSGLGYKTQDGSSDTDYKTNTRTSKSGNNYELQATSMNLTIASSTNPSGSYTFEHWWFAKGTWTDTYYLKNGSSNCTFTYKIAPPAVKSSSVSISATNTAAGSGTGLSSGSPIILISGMSSTLTITAMQNHSDANSALWCKFGSGSYSSTTTYNIASGTTTTNQTLTLKVKYRNNSASLDGAETSTTIYYKWAAPAPAIVLSSVSPSSSIVAGNDITLVGTRANSTSNISFQYTTDDGSSWTDITPKTTSGTSTKTITWTIPDAHGATQTFKFRAKLAEATPIYSAKSDGVSVYNTKTIHVKNSNNWPSLYLYAWDGSSHINGAWPGKSGVGNNGLSCTQIGGGLWWDVVITSNVATFVLNRNLSGDDHQTEDLSYSTYTHDRCIAVGTASGKKKLPNTAVSCLSAPTVTTASVTPTVNNKATLGGNVTALGNDKVTSFGYYYSTNSALSSSNLGVGTRVEVGTAKMSTGAYSNEQTGLTGGTTYYVIAYATNGLTTSYGSKVSFTTPYKVTITNPTGGTFSATGAQYVSSTLAVTCTAATGYTFSSWSAVNCSMTSTSTSSGVTTATLTPTADNATLTATYTENMTTVNLVATPTGKGTFTIGGASVTSTTAGVATTRSVTAVAGTGYRVNTSATVWTKSNSYINLNNVKANPVTVTGAGSGGTSTLTATFTPKTYTITLHEQGATTHGSPSDGGTITVTYDATTNLSKIAAVPEKSGYTFDGYYANEGCTGPWIIQTNTYFNWDGTYINSSTGVWQYDGNLNLYAKWVANQYTVTLDVDEENKGTIAGATTSQNIYYNDPTVTVPNRPTAANGYALDGYYTDHNGAGTKVINANGTWIASVAGYTDGSKRWIHADNVTLYAYYKKAEITVAVDQSIFSPVAAGGASWVQATPTVAPTPVGDTKICWALLYDDENPVPAGHDPVIVSGDVVKFNLAGLAAGNYRIRATLRTGTTCDGGTLLGTFDKTITIASDFKVTVRYRCGDVDIKEPIVVDAHATSWTTISAPDIFGYTFTTWDLGDGGITKHGSDALTKQADFRFKATYNGTLTAVYRKKGIIYFKKPSDWTGTKVYYYNLGSSDKWHTTEGDWKKRGIYTEDISWGAHEMTRITGTNIYYYDYEAENNAAANPGDYIAFADASQDGYKPIYNCKASYPIQYTKGFNTGTPMFVCTNYSNSEIWNDVKYYNHGYWTKYERGSGYTLKIYNKKESGRQEIKSVPFVTDGTNNFEIPFKATVDLDAATTYGFKIVRDDNLYFKNDNDETMTYSSHDGWPFLYDGSDGSACGITTTAAGSYVFTLSYFNTGNNADHELRVSVTYPAAVNDFQVYYRDASKPAHPSRMIKARAGGVDTISFFVHKTNTPMLKARKVTNASTMTWGALNIEGAESMSLDVDSSAVYNFKVTQGSAGVISSIVNIGAYTGEYYIRCGALNSKWDNYTIDGDHKMTYSSFSESDANAFGEKFSHYKAKWCPRGTNVKFVIANDYSPCISDTLIQDVGNPYNNIYLDDAWGRPDGELKADGYDGSGNITTSETGDRYSANIRFMWNRKTNKISRAYVASSTNPERLFLVLRGNYAIKGLDDSNIEDEGTDIPSVILKDDQNWIYEEILYIKPGTRFKLYACYAQESAGPDGAQYFRGAYESGAWAADNTKSVILIDGTGDYQKVRVLYDFKTNRLICAWLPDGAVSGDMNINSDVMIIREHQEAAQYLSFASAESQLTGVKTVYGVMKFNRWVLNNRKQTGAHLPLDVGDQKSIYERSLYFISFPFDVRVSDIFGFGRYWDEWYLEYYDGETRAKTGFWIDSPPNWKYIYPSEATNYVLKANVGYILGLDLDYMAYNNEEFWAHDIETIELFFPSTMDLGTLKQTTCTIPALGDGYLCSINRTGIDGDRRVKDSYWRCIGVPSLNLYNTAVKDGSGNTITWKTDYTWHSDESEFPFIYMWNKSDNTLTPQATSTFNFLPMHSYLVQNGKQIIWTNVSAKSSIVARRAQKEDYREFNWRLALMSDTTLIDQTYIRMSELEQITDSFDFGQDMSKEFNATRSDLFTISNDVRLAANSMPLNTETMTIVPVGVRIKKEGEFTLSMPDGTYGVSITLVDNYNGTRTELGAGFTYTFESEVGLFDDRFHLEIAKVKDIATDLGNVPSDDVQGTKARKVLINGILYIVREGKLYDARGTRVE